jgi:hypothetical protein
MYRFVILITIVAFAWSAGGCGGPGKPVNKAADLRNQSGGNSADNSGGQRSGFQGGPRNRDGSKKDEKDEKQDESKADEGDSKTAPQEPSSTGDPLEPGTGEGGAGSSVAAKQPATPPVTASRRNRPPGLGIAAPGIGNRKKNDKKDEKKEEPGESAGESQPEAVVDDAPAEEHRFSFFERANYAFSTENETEGFQYLYAHAIAEDNALEIHPLAWYAGLNEPRLGLRWGVGVDYRPGKFEGDPPRFGTGSDSSTSSGGGNAGGGDGGELNGRDVGNRLPNGRRPQQSPQNRQTSPGNAPSGDDPTEQLLYYTGDFGDLLVQRIEMRRTNSDFYWGKALHEIDATKTFEEKQAPVAGAPSNRGGRGAERSSGRGRGSGGAGLGMDDDLAGNTSPGTASNPPAANANDGRVTPKEIPGFEPEFEANATSLVPGAMMLGLGKKNELLERARAHGLDLLAVFDVGIQFSSRDEAKNTTMLTIIDVKTGEDVIQTRKLNTAAYSKALESGKENPIEMELDKAFPDKTDKEFKCSELPNISDEAASRRIEALLESAPANPLPVLVEIRYYLDQGLISKSDYVAAAEALIGPENARKLVDGDIKQREEALHDWLPGQYTVNVPSSEFR